MITFYRDDDGTYGALDQDFVGFITLTYEAPSWVLTYQVRGGVSGPVTRGIKTYSASKAKRAAREHLEMVRAWLPQRAEASHA